MHAIPPLAIRIEQAAEADRSVSHLMATVDKKYSMELSKLCRRDVGFGSADCRLIAYLARHRNGTSAEIGKGLDIDKALVSRCVARLRRRGVVGAKDIGGGAREIFLTEAGLAVHDKVVEMARSHEERLLEGLNGTERRLLVHLLRKLNANLAKMTQSSAPPKEKAATVG